MIEPPDPAELRVLIVDDSALFRTSVAAAIREMAGVRVVGTAADGAQGIDQAIRLNPDVITLDVEMPVLDGIQTLREMKRREIRIPTIMLSSLTHCGASVTLQALFEGALDFIPKPTGGIFKSRHQLRDALVEKFAAVRVNTSKAGNSAPTVKRASTGCSASSGSSRLKPQSHQSAQSAECRIVVIGLSTGGPQTLRYMLPKFGPDFPLPIIVVQHMPAAYTSAMASRLDAISPLRVIEAADQMPIEPGNIYVAPGGVQTKPVENGLRSAAAGTASHSNNQNFVFHTTEDAPENGCRPAVDFTLRWTTLAYAGEVLAVIMTGMGKDGLAGCSALKAAGGTVFAQDRETSAVFGMPKAVIDAGIVDRTLPLGKIAPAIVRHVRRAIRGGAGQ